MQKLTFSVSLSYRNTSSKSHSVRDVMCALEFLAKRANSGLFLVLFHVRIDDALHRKHLVVPWSLCSTYFCSSFFQSSKQV